MCKLLVCLEQKTAGRAGSEVAGSGMALHRARTASRHDVSYECFVVDIIDLNAAALYPRYPDSSSLRLGLVKIVPERQDCILTVRC